MVCTATALVDAYDEADHAVADHYQGLATVLLACYQARKAMEADESAMVVHNSDERRAERRAWNRQYLANIEEYAHHGGDDY
jgi:protoporphyrinogen oxidase